MIVAIVVVAVAVLFGVSSMLSRAGQIKRQLPPMVGKTVGIALWGSAQQEAVVESVFAIGAGLHIYFRREGSRVHLKVAQPTSVSIAGTRIEIADARYVQWADRKVRRSEGPAVVLEMGSEL